jgi:hypothetical protein
MGSHHYLMLAGVLILGYVLARYFPQPAHAVGLP